MNRLLMVSAILLCLPHLAHAGSDDRDPPAELPDCSEAEALPCFETVWVDGVPLEMDFFDLDVKTSPPTHNFYVVGPQTDTPQGTTPFLHDHVVGDVDGLYWHGFLAVCSPQGIASGACATSALAGDPPLARTVHGRKLMTTEAVESAARSGLVVLVDTGAVLLAKTDPCARRHHRR